MTTAKAKIVGPEGEGPTASAAVSSSDLATGPDAGPASWPPAALGTRPTPNTPDVGHWAPGAGAVGSRLQIEATGRASAALAAALDSPELGPSARAELLAEVNQRLAAANIILIDPTGPTGPSPQELALAAADALADIMQVAPLHAEHRGECWQAALAPLRRAELDLARTDLPARQPRPPRL